MIKYFDLPGIDAPDKRIAGYEAFFNYIIAFVVGDGNQTRSQLLDTEGKALPMWIKMLPNYDSDPKRANKYYTVSRFINQGVFEGMKVEKGLPLGSPKIIRVKPTEKLELTANTGAPSGGGAFNPSATPGGAGAIDPAVAALLAGK